MLLQCLVDGDSVKHAFSVVVEPTLTVSELKEVVYAENLNRFRNLDACELQLFRIDCPVANRDERFQSKLHSESLTPLFALNALTTYWHEEPPRNTLQIVVVPPPPRIASGHRSFADLNLWKKWWPRVGYYPPPITNMHPVERDCTHPDIEVPKSCEVIDVDEFIPRVSKLLVRADYKEAYDAVLAACYNSRSRGIVIVGNPGTGKTMFLYYLLVLRLSEGRPTALQLDAHSVILFTKQGNRTLDPNVHWSRVKPSIEKGTWVLFDSSYVDIQPGGLVAPYGSPFFIVEAASPHYKHWKWTRAHDAFPKFYMMPWSEEEIIVGRALQRGNIPLPSEKRLSEFYRQYGPSARDAYALAGNPRRYHNALASTIGRLHHDQIDALLRSGDSLQMEDGSHRVVFVQPNKTCRFDFSSSVVSKTIMALLWPAFFRGQEEHIRHYFMLYSTDPLAKASAGWILEFNAHDLFRAGGQWPMYSMTTSHGPSNYTFTYVKGSSTVIGNLSLPPLEHRSFGSRSGKLCLADHVYYQPETLDYPTADSLTYNAANSEVTIYQVTVADAHDVKEQGINELLNVFDYGQVEGGRVRYIAVVEQGQEKLEIKIPRSLVDNGVILSITTVPLCISESLN